MGGGALDVYRVCERMAAIDLGIATSVLATFLGSDPIRVGGTDEQKRECMTRIAKDGVLFAYGATEPDAGSDLGALKTIAEPVAENGTVTGYRISGAKQWISNGGVADLYTVLALAPGGPSWFVVEGGAEGFTHGDHEDKHGIRLSNTAALFLDKVYVDADRLVGGVEGQGLVQAQQVFGYTRLMVAAFGLGAGWAALDRAIPYSRERIQAGGPLSEKQGYTHKLIVPHAVALEAARAAIEETAERIDAGEGALNTEGAIAKYLATEAGNAAADAAIQAHGGYGYTHEYIVEKIKRDVRITTIYEGTSEIMEMTIARERWQQHLKTRGDHYHARPASWRRSHAEHPDGRRRHRRARAPRARRAARGLPRRRLTRNQHVLLRLGALIAQRRARRRSPAARARRRPAAAPEGRAQPSTPSALAAVGRVYARDAALTDRHGGDPLGGGRRRRRARRPRAAPRPAGDPGAQAGLLADMQTVADALYARKRPDRQTYERRPDEP